MSARAATRAPAVSRAGAGSGVLPHRPVPSERVLSRVSSTTATARSWSGSTARSAIRPPQPSSGPSQLRSADRRTVPSALSSSSTVRPWASSTLDSSTARTPRLQVSAPWVSVTEVRGASVPAVRAVTSMVLPSVLRVATHSSSSHGSWAAARWPAASGTWTGSMPPKRGAVRPDPGVGHRVGDGHAASGEAETEASRQQAAPADRGHGVECCVHVGLLL